MQTFLCAKRVHNYSYHGCLYSPRANAKMALEELHNIINSQMNAYPEGAVIIAGDFNRTDLKTVMPE